MSAGRRPQPRYLPAHHVLSEMASFGRDRLQRLRVGQVLVLAVLGGGFITTGALLSLLLADGAGTAGTARLLQGLGFSAGFFFVVLSEAVLFTEANVVMPATLLNSRAGPLRVARFWVLAVLGNFVGAVLTGLLLVTAQSYTGDVLALLRETVDSKMRFYAAGTAAAWFQALLSGVLANWLVGMAAFFAMMGRTIFGKYVPVALAVTLFVAAGLQHSPANMGYFALLMLQGEGPGWLAAIAWNLVPVGIGNLLGGTLLVALPFWYAFRGTADPANG